MNIFFHAQEDSIAVFDFSSPQPNSKWLSLKQRLCMKQRNIIVPINAIRVGMVGRVEALIAADDEGDVAVWFLNKRNDFIVDFTFK